KSGRAGARFFPCVRTKKAQDVGAGTLENKHFSTRKPGFRRRRKMNEDQQRSQLDAILHAAFARPRSVRNYAEMPLEEFILIWHFRVAVESFASTIVWWGFCRSRHDIRTNALDEIGRLFSAEPSDPSTLTREKILALTRWYYEPGLYSVLAEYAAEQPYVI